MVRDCVEQSRPYNVSKHWAAALESEWTSQLLLEQHLHLPATVKPSDHPLGQAKGQVFFISAFAKPLFELVAQGIPGMHHHYKGRYRRWTDEICHSELEEFAQQCRDNLAIWTERSEHLTADEPPSPRSNASQTQRVEEFLSAFPPTLPDRFRLPEEPLSPLMSNHSPSLSQSSGSSHYESCESGPPSPSASSPVPTPQSPNFPHVRLDIGTPLSSHLSSRPPSIASVSSYSTQATDATAAIRAAYKASVRKKKSFHRSSWNPTGSGPAGRTYSFAQSFGPTAGADGPGPLTADSSPLSTHSSSPLTPLSPTTATNHHRPSPLGTAAAAAACTQET